MRPPEPKKGPSATAMERRGERSEMGARHAGMLAERDDLASQERDVRGRMRPENTAWKARPTAELFGEMEGIRAALVRNRAELLARREALQAPRVASRRQIETALTRRELQERKRAEFALKKAREDAIAGGISARAIARWFVDPGGALMAAVGAGHRHFDRLEAADQSLKSAELALGQKRAWLRSDEGQAQGANLREPSVQASVDVANQRRAMDRRARRLGAQIVRVDRTLRDLAIAEQVGIDRIKVPGEVPRDGTREAAQVRYVAAIAGPTRTAIGGVPKPLLQKALRAIQLQANAPDQPERGPDVGPDLTPDF
jgi:hypothetical protein